MAGVEGLVRVDHDFQQGCRVIKTVQTFRRGAVLVKERALVEADADNDVARVVAYLSMSQDDLREMTGKVITDLELGQFGYEAKSLDSAEMMRLLVEAGQPDLDPRRAADAIVRWRMSSSVSRTRIYRTISKTTHSCSAQVELENVGAGVGVLSARHEIGPSVRVGAWLLPDCHLWWRGANVRSRELRTLDMLPLEVQECSCERCQGLDTCRALRCPKCRKGELVLNGKAKMWRCEACGFEGADGVEEVAALLREERLLRQELTGLDEAGVEELHQARASVASKIGTGHWLHALAWYQLYLRQLGPEKQQSFCTVAAGLGFLDWLASRKLQTPPAALVEELVAMIFGILEFLKSIASGDGVRDLRVMFLRTTSMAQELLEGFGNPSLHERIKPMLALAVRTRRSCGFCKSRLKELKPEVYPETFGDEDGGICEEHCPTGCRICDELSYCDLSCQVADAPRHRAFCIPCGESLGSERARRILVQTS